MSFDQVTAFFGWCSVINLILLAVSALALSVFQSTLLQLHSQIFSLPVERLRPIYLRVLGQYKILILVFNLVPYFALRLIS